MSHPVSTTGTVAVVRAVLILTVLMAWAACLLGAVAVPTYLVTTVALARRRRGPAHPPPRVAVVAFALFAAAMATCAVILGSLVRLGHPPGPWSSAVAWASLPAWTALCSAAAALVLGRRRRRGPTPA